jgi:uncharacterized protein DUF3631
LGDQDWVVSRLGQLLDAGGDVDGVADQRELQLASPADGARDHCAGVDADADPKLATESLGDEAVDQHSGVQRRVGVIRKIIRRTEDSQSAVAKELIDMPTGIHNSGHHNLEQGVEPGNGVLGGVCLGERGEVADVDEHHRHFSALPGKYIVTLLEQPRREGWIDVGPKGRLKSLPLSQTRLHPVERRRQRAKVIVLNHGQSAAVDSFLRSIELVRELKERDESPWKDNELTPHKLAKMLRPFDIRPRYGGGGHHRGYFHEDFVDSFLRYNCDNFDTAT